MRSSDQTGWDQMYSVPTGVAGRLSRQGSRPRSHEGTTPLTGGFCEGPTSAMRMRMSTMGFWAMPRSWTLFSSRKSNLSGDSGSLLMNIEPAPTEASMPSTRRRLESATAAILKSAVRASLRVVNSSTPLLSASSCMSRPGWSPAGPNLSARGFMS